MSRFWRRPLAPALALAMLLAGALGTGCTPARPGTREVGRASWYGGRFHGRRTASGERFDKNALTAAHRELPFGTRVRVTNQRNGRSVIVTITDRGPFGGRRIIDLSERAARDLGMIDDGVVPVAIEILSMPE